MISDATDKYLSVLHGAHSPLASRQPPRTHAPIGRSFLFPCHKLSDGGLTAPHRSPASASSIHPVRDASRNLTPVRSILLITWVDGVTKHNARLSRYWIIARILYVDKMRCKLATSRARRQGPATHCYARSTFPYFQTNRDYALVSYDRPYFVVSRHLLLFSS